MAYKPPLFDPALDPKAEFDAALQQAQHLQKPILVELGADWCDWCHRLEAFILGHPHLLSMRSLCFVRVKIFVGEEDQSTFLETLPTAEAIPHYFVYSPLGQLLHSQPTLHFEEDESYNHGKLQEFFLTWGNISLNSAAN